MKTIYAVFLIISSVLSTQTIPSTVQAPVQQAPVQSVQEIQIPAIMLKIAQCESGGNQFSNGSVLKGRENPHDIGLFQINELVWGDKAKELGFDIYTEKGNTAMALWIYQNYGTSAWRYSQSCWIQKTTY